MKYLLFSILYTLPIYVLILSCQEAYTTYKSLDLINEQHIVLWDNYTTSAESINQIHQEEKRGSIRCFFLIDKKPYVWFWFQGAKKYASFLWPEKAVRRLAISAGDVKVKNKIPIVTEKCKLYGAKRYAIKTCFIREYHSYTVLEINATIYR